MFLSNEKKLRALVAEDSQLNNKLVCVILENEGFDCVGVFDGEAACREYSLGGYDILVVDAEMPIMSGLEVVEKIRSGEDANAKFPIILMTGDTYENSKDTILKYKLNGFVEKPVDNVQLYEQLKSIFEEKH